MCDTYTHAFMTRSGKTAFSFTAPDLFANLIFFHKQNKQTKTTPPKKEQKEKVIIKILTFKRSISLMQSCLALASIISKIFKHKNTEDRNEATKKVLYTLTSSWCFLPQFVHPLL